jgi:hypothetical protein
MFLIGLDLPEINNVAFRKRTLLKDVGVFSPFQQLIGVQDEDSCGRSDQCEIFPALAARGLSHKPCHPIRQKAPLWLPCLMLVASE